MNEDVRILIEIENGCVMSVWSNHKNVLVDILDWDVSKEDDGYIRVMKKENILTEEELINEEHFPHLIF